MHQFTVDNGRHISNVALQWRHDEHDSVSNHRRLDCLLHHMFRRRSKKTSKCRVTGFCEGNPSVTGGFDLMTSSCCSTVLKVRRQPTTWTNAYELIIALLGTNVSVIWVKHFLWKKHFLWRKIIWTCRVRKDNDLFELKCVNVHLLRCSWEAVDEVAQTRRVSELLMLRCLIWWIGSLCWHQNICVSVKVDDKFTTDTIHADNIWVHS